MRRAAGAAAAVGIALTVMAGCAEPPLYVELCGTQDGVRADDDYCLEEDDDYTPGFVVWHGPYNAKVPMVSGKFGPEFKRGPAPSDRREYGAPVRGRG